MLSPSQISDTAWVALVMIWATGEQLSRIPSYHQRKGASYPEATHWELNAVAHPGIRLSPAPS
jgi:hypothetical protein